MTTPTKQDLETARAIAMSWLNNGATGEKELTAAIAATLTKQREETEDVPRRAILAAARAIESESLGLLSRRVRLRKIAAIITGHLRDARKEGNK